MSKTEKFIEELRDEIDRLKGELADQVERYSEYKHGAEIGLATQAAMLEKVEAERDEWKQKYIQAHEVANGLDMNLSQAKSRLALLEDVVEAANKSKLYMMGAGFVNLRDTLTKLKEVT